MSRGRPRGCGGEIAVQQASLEELFVKVVKGCEEGAGAGEEEDSDGSVGGY